jgi:hypothetical protein
MNEVREKLKSGITPPRILRTEVASVNRSVDRFMGLFTKWSSRLDRCSARVKSIEERSEMPESKVLELKKIVALLEGQHRLEVKS